MKRELEIKKKCIDTLLVMDNNIAVNIYMFIVSFHGRF